MTYNPQLWKRYEFEQLPIYIRSDRPTWFVPNRSGNEILNGPQNQKSPYREKFLARLPDAPVTHYEGRSQYLKTDQLKELWLHITNRCNLSCQHCLFTSGPTSTEEMSAELILNLAKEAVDLGCKIFALTGGEPFFHPEIDKILSGLLKFPECHVVILTNGLLLEEKLTDNLDLSRVHLQISVDGLNDRHDAIRGQGTFVQLRKQLLALKQRGIPFTLSMCVERRNLHDMAGLVDFAAEVGASNLHYLWYFIQGRGNQAGFVPAEEIFPQFITAVEKAEHRGIQIDNLAALQTQIFAPAGTIHDGSGSGCESAAIGPDGNLYPSAALVGNQELKTSLTGTLAEAWHNSPTLQKIRRATIANSDAPLRYFTGGGDLDHSWIHGNQFSGTDPYLPLYEKIIFWLIKREANRLPERDQPGLKLKMGDILENCGAHGHVALTHANCLLSIADQNSRTVVKNYYSTAATDTKEDILNPVCYTDEDISHIPEKYRFRGYGCGSPVLDAEIKAGETVVDLGSGRGIEIFIAARIVGKKGQSIGIDMLDPMLAIAEQGATEVRKNLRFDNIEFRKGYLEELPLKTDSTDLMLSNCVLNLSADKRRAFAEIFRSLKPGGRLVISDVVCEEEPDAAIRNDAELQGECIAGALLQKDLVGLLEESGFVDIRLLKRFPYRVVRDHPFFSLTFAAWKPGESQPVPVIYRGPLPQLPLPDGTFLFPGQKTLIAKSLAEHLDEHIFLLDSDDGSVTNLDLADGCACALPPETTTSPAPSVIKYRSGCMVCGGDLIYPDKELELACHYCGQTSLANSHCGKKHFVCDHCHSEDALDVMEHLCVEATETDMLEILARLRKHPSIPVHGPEHHALMPAIIVTAYRNSGGHIEKDLIATAIRRGNQIIGGSCAFTGICGSATGVGIAFSLLLQANPVKAEQRQIIQQITQQVLADIADLKAARCCQRDCWLGLKKAAELSKKYLPIPLQADAIIGCYQQHQNKECMGMECPVLQEQRTTQSEKSYCC
jgi:MoaA/NifB/PqqE/SkfB family radical SAM enzyme/SAM-dependent methyltransferase